MLAVIQLRATADVALNLAKAMKLVRQAAVEHHANFVCLPEAIDYIVDFKIQPDARPKPQSLAGERLESFSTLAKELGVWISIGGIHEARVDGKQHNTHIILDSNGSVRTAYRKIHLFDAKVENGFRESDSVMPGSEIFVVKDTPIGNVGVSTCYDVRFPFMYAAMRDAGADVFLVPSAFTMVTGAAHWHTLVRARAIENQVYLAAAAQVGPHNDVRSSYGHSLIVGPFGEIMIDLGQKEDAIGCVRIDKERILAVREAMPVAMHRHKADVVVNLQTDRIKIV